MILKPDIEPVLKAFNRASHRQILKNTLKALFGVKAAASPVPANTETQAQPVKKILMVGARLSEPVNASGKPLRHPNRAKPMRLDFMDASYLLQALRSLRDVNIPVDPAVDVSVVNLSKNYGGQDFLMGQYDADMIVTCYVCNSDEESEYFQESVDNEDFLLLSEKRNEKDVWLNAALRSGARFVLTVGETDLEINHLDFVGAQFSIKKKYDYMPFISRGRMWRPNVLLQSVESRTP